jgi:hypothetical protein
MAKMRASFGSTTFWGPAGISSRVSRSPAGVPELDEAVQRGSEFDALVEGIRRLMASDTTILFARLEDRLRRRLGIAPLRVESVTFTLLFGVSIRLALALFATTVVGDWSEIPWGRWAVIIGFFGLYDVASHFMNRPVDMPSSPWAARIVEDHTALITTIVHESDLRNLADYTRRWNRLWVSVAVGVVVTAMVLMSCWLFTPGEVSEVPAGSIVLLILLLLEFGDSIVLGSLFSPAFLAREARYDHHLFWPSPVDSPPVKQALRGGTSVGYITGIWITIFLLLVVVLVSWDSSMVIPLTVGFIVIGYLSTIVATLMRRGSIHRIVERTRDKWLTVMQHRIEAFGPPVTDLSADESERLGQLIDIHNAIRDAPTTPTTARTVVHTAVGLIIPTIMFLITVFGEVYAERFLDAFLP